MKTDSPEVNYTRLEVTCPETHTDILIAELAEVGFAVFMETYSGFETDAEEGTIEEASIEAVIDKYRHTAPITFRITSLQKENWNELWEKNVTPVYVEKLCLIRASFHEPHPDYPYEIVITPKMSFGTGHHPTTYLMVKAQMKMDHAGKRVMDAGCGTAILSIMAAKLGAREVEAFDVDEWSIINGRENATLNNCNQIRIRQGTIADFDWPESFDIILANINRNILLSEMAKYAKNLSQSGSLVLSGFYVNDIHELLAAANRHGLVSVSQDEREGWACVILSPRAK